MSEKFDLSQTQWNRRQLLKAGGILLVSNGLLSLIGCGGGGTGGTYGAISLETFSGTVTLPAGVDASTLLIGVGLGTTTLTNGKFSAPAPTDAPSLVTVLDPSTKKAILMGMTDPSQSRATTIDATSTAVALLFFALGGSSMTRDGIKPLVDLIKTDPATATLASVIASRTQASPFAVGDGDSQIVAALSTAANSIANGSGFPAARPLTTSGGSGLLQIQPTGEANGVTMINLDTTTGFAVQNTKRRLGYVYTYLTTHVDFNNSQNAVNPPVQVGNILEVPSTSSLLKLGSGWAPVTSATVPMQVQDGDSKSIYTLVYLTQVYGATEPAFFKDSQWSQEVGKWRASLGELGQDTFVGFFTNLILSAIGFGGLTWAHAQLAAAITSFRTIPSVSALIDMAAGEDVLLGDLAKQALTEFLSGDIAQQLLGDMAKLVSTVSQQAEAYLAEGATSAAGLAAIQAAVATLIVSGAVLLAGDIGAIAKDTTFGDKGDLWTATVVRPTIAINPVNPTANPGDRISFSVKTPSTVSGTIEYDWTQTGTFATLSSSDGKVGSAITTTSRNVDLITTASDTGPIVVAVIAYQVEGGNRTEIGKAQSSVTLSSGNTTPGQVTVTISGFSNLSIGGKTYQDGTYAEAAEAGYGSGNGTHALSIGSSGEVPFSLIIKSQSGVYDGTYTLVTSGDGAYFNSLVSWQLATGSVTVSSKDVDGGKKQYTFSWDLQQGQFQGPDLHTRGSGSVVI